MLDNDQRRRCRPSRGAGAGVEQDDEPIRIGERRRAQQHRMDDAEHRRRGADAERERGNRQDGHATHARQRPHGVAKVAGEASHQIVMTMLRGRGVNIRA